MRKLLSCLSSILLAVMPIFAEVASASDESKDDARLRNCGTVLKEILDVPDNIPQDLLDKADCIVVFPSDVVGLHQPNRYYDLCFGVLASRVEINGSAAGRTATFPDRTISFAGIFLPYTCWLSPLSGRIVEPSRETPANRPRALE